jgi:eukaryotic translation initiation factor 2C
MQMAPASPAPFEPTAIQGTLQDVRQEHTQALMILGKDIVEKKQVPEHPLRREFRQAESGVRTNHFPLKIDPNTQLYEYSIVISPAKMDKSMTKQIIKEFIEEETTLKNNQDFFATDYASKIVAWKELPYTIKSINATRSPAPISIKVGKRTFSVRLQELRTIETGVLQDYSKAVFPAKTELASTIGTTVNALNILISKAISGQSILLKSNKFFVKSGHSDLGSSNGSLCAIRGYFYTVKPGMGEMLLNINACTSAFFRPKLVSQVLQDQSTFGAFGNREEALKGLRVYITYERNSKGSIDLNAMEFRTKRITGFGKPLCEQTFQLRSDNGTREITVEEYVKVTYKVKVEYPELKAVNLGSQQRPSWFAPEHLRILPYQMFTRLLPERLTNGMLDVACRPPARTQACIELEGLLNLGFRTGQGIVSFVGDSCPSPPQ